MPTIRQPINQWRDPQGNLHLSCLLSTLEFIYNGQILLNTERTPQHFTALLDTGASKTYIGQGIVEGWGLQPRVQNVEEQETAVTGNTRVNVSIYDNIEIRFPHNLGVFNLPVRCTGARYQMDFGTQHHLIIGMDILSQGIFMLDGITNRNAKTWSLTFP